MSENSLKKCVPIEIPDDNPFQNDVLNRKDNIETLTTFITSFEQSIVLCIDGGWGQGKTTFIRMWEKYLNQQSIPTIYFNTWESDYTDDALIALIGEIDLAAEKLAIQDKNEAEKSIKKIYGFAANFLKATAPTLANLGIKAVSGGLTNTDELTKTLSSLSESLVEEHISQYKQSRKTLGNFKKHSANSPVFMRMGTRIHHWSSLLMSWIAAALILQFKYWKKPNICLMWTILFLYWPQIKAS